MRRSRTIAALTLALCAVGGLTSVTVAGVDDCPADVDGSGDIGFNDLVLVLSNWGPCPGCPEDLNGDGEVGFSDLIEVLSLWGPCPT